MNYKLDVWLDDKSHTVEGHTSQCSLYFKDKRVWGPVRCHNNTVQLKEAIEKADDRFSLTVEPKSKTVEGHTRCISVKSKGEIILDRLSTHNNMTGLVTVITAILSIEG
ncbi:hypothetical protein F4811DRAFT_526656 [Daldinia bambusicola]|nr:hypothetical protein F4811DRAFT_526656 [Daldinia bambusicola]